MGKDIDAYVEDYTEWLHDMHSQPGYIECDNCGEFYEEDTPGSTEFDACFFCCEACFEQALLSNEDLQEAWKHEGWCEDEPSPV